MLVRTKADINKNDFDDTTLIHVTVCYSRINIVQFLIKANADVKFHSQTYEFSLIAALKESLTSFL